MGRYYDIADIRVRIDNRFSYTDSFCRDYLALDQNAPAEIVASATKEDCEEEKVLSAGFSDGYVENICIYRNLCTKLPLYNGFLLHASVVEYEGSAYAFLGRSGTGKSTHTSLWLRFEKGAKILNGDKPIVRIMGDEITVFGTPWMGKENRGYNGKAPLKALCFLEQSTKNELLPLEKGEVVKRVFRQIVLPTENEAVKKTLELIDKLVSNVPAYLLRCDVSREAFETSFCGLTGKEKKDEN